MESKIVDLSLNMFNVEVLIDEPQDINLEYIKEKIVIIKEKLINLNSPIILSLKEEEELLKKIKSIYQVRQEEGSVILGNDTTHDYLWFEKLKKSETYDAYYWTRYKEYLLKKKHFSPAIVDRLENTTLKDIMSYIGDPNMEKTIFSVRGLVVGDVQSGKTSNYIGLINQAADAGYKVIILLTGLTESLRQQTQIRVEEGFIGYDSANAMEVGVGRHSNKMPKAFTSREHDFVGKNDQNTNFNLNGQIMEPLIFVIKKNKTVLKKLFTCMKNLNTSSFSPYIDQPLIMIDDEADNASINTSNDEYNPTQINQYIRKILKLFTKNCYIGFTATPFANVFISFDSESDMKKDDLFPKDFIYALESPSNYCGARKYFYGENECLKLIEDDNQAIFPINHKKEWNGNKLFPSVYEAINVFFLANTIRDLEDLDIQTHRSMLINMSRFKNVQSTIKSIVEEYFDNIMRAIKQTYKMPIEKALQNELIAFLKKTFDNEYKDKCKYGWNEIFSKILYSIKSIKIVVVNSSRDSTKINYENHKEGYRVIAIGGLALSRGLTLEGLMVSYFYRNTATFDVLMQMGRWFGYRNGYEQWVRIYLTKEAKEYYREISESIEGLKNDIKKMSKAGKRPEDYGIRVRNNSDELGITASNKMRATKKRPSRTSFFGRIYETPYIDRNVEIISYNVENTLDFLKSLPVESMKEDVRYPYFQNIPSSYIIEFLSKVNVHSANENFDTKQIIKFIKEEDLNGDFKNFDILVIGGESSKSLELNNVCIPLVQRRFDLKYQDQIIRINAQRARLGGKRDTAYGLSQEQKKKIEAECNPTANDYLNVDGRNPLLIVYFLDPSNEKARKKQDEESYVFFEIEKKEKKLIDELANTRYKCLVGFGIGFPSIKGKKEETTYYVVNSTCDYFEKMHEEDIEEYGEEDI